MVPFPTWWHYDVLRGLDICAARESRLTARIRGDRPGRVEARRRRPVAARYPVPGRMPVDMDGAGAGRAGGILSAPCVCSVGTNRPVRKAERRIYSLETLSSRSATVSGMVTDTVMSARSCNQWQVGAPHISFGIEIPFARPSPNAVFSEENPPIS